VPHIIVGQLSLVDKEDHQAEITLASGKDRLYSRLIDFSSSLFRGFYCAVV